MSGGRFASAHGPVSRDDMFIQAVSSIEEHLGRSIGDSGEANDSLLDSEDGTNVIDIEGRLDNLRGHAEKVAGGPRVGNG